MTSQLLASDTIVRTSTGEAVAFWVLGALALIGAIGVVLAVNAVYSAMFLAMTMIILAVFYMIQDALFLGVVQVVVYTGAVMMLFLFVLMLIGVDSAESLKETLHGQRIAAVLAGIGFGVLLIAAIGTAATVGFAGLTTANANGNVEGLAALEAFAVGQHHRADGRGDQQRAGEFERPDVPREDQRRKPFHVAVGVGGGQAREADGRGGA
ncbi:MULTISPECIES: NADH-quinone oxidoreductase subunit J, partial [unclassified Mycobacterium]|uniref:NADH-quinone oxidoreductase subunit J n=1 Tax=unclassified Mycobacterium TaxID=2642494 RepID=UPI001E2DAE56